MYWLYRLSLNVLLSLNLLGIGYTDYLLAYEIAPESDYPHLDIQLCNTGTAAKDRT